MVSPLNDGRTRTLPGFESHRTREGIVQIQLAQAAASPLTKLISCYRKGIISPTDNNHTV
jgi:hypothetical protein